MTPPKVTANQSQVPTLSCERPVEPITPVELPKAEDMQVFELAYPPLVKDPVQPYSPFANRFDPTRYGLPADWKPQGDPIDPENKFVEFDPKNMPADFLAGTPNLFPEKPPWLEDIIHLLNQVKRADLDMYNIAVNQGTNMRRFSEYAPKNKPLRAPNLDVQENTTAYVRGEIRPVEGQPDSLITRWIIRYNKPLLHESGLHILGFSAADAPDVEYDQKFKDWQAVKNITGGDLDYENPQQTGDPLTTPWNYVAPPLPEGHRDWMIAFNPVVDSIFASIKSAGGFGQLDGLSFWPFKGAIDGGRGKLYLWAFNPTFGITPQFANGICGGLRERKTPEKDLPVHCKIRPNTMPRKPGDLLDFFSPIFDSYRGGLLKHAAPYYNPNSEYIAPFIERGEKLLQWAQKKLGRDYSQPETACKDLKGQWNQDNCLLPQPQHYGEIFLVNEEREKECKELTREGKEESCQLPIGRNPIPRQASQVDRINQELARFGLPPIGRRRGSIIDWGNLDLLLDPERLEKMDKKPYTLAHLQLNPGVLPMSFGKLTVDEKTDVKVEFFALPAQVPDLDHPGQTKMEANVGLRVTLSPLKLNQTDLRAMGFHIKADGLEAQELQIQIPNVLGMGKTQAGTRPPMTAKIIGGTARGLQISDQQGDVDITMDRATLEELNFHFDHPPLLFGSQEEKAAERSEQVSRNQSLDCSAKGNPCHEPEWAASFKGLKGTGLTVGVPQIKGLKVSQFSIPTMEVSQRFKTKEEEIVSDLLAVKIPALESKGSLDLDFQKKQEGGDRGSSVHLEGASVLENVNLTSQFFGDHSLLVGDFDLKGTIDSATLTKEELGEISFTTKTNGHPIKPLSGHIKMEINNPAKLPYQQERPKGPPPKFDLDLDLPYVGLESKGAFTMAPGSATLRDGQVHLHSENKIKGTIEGQLNLGDGSYQHLKKQPLEMGRMDMLPALKGSHAKGNFKFEIFEDGFRLSNPLYDRKNPQHPPLSLGFRIDGTKLHHCPTFPEGYNKKITKGEAFETLFQLDSGDVEVQDLASFEMRNLTVDGETKSSLTSLESGPLLVRNIEGGGSVWLNSVLFGFVKLSIPHLGGPLSAEDARLPNARALTAHLPEEHKKKLREALADGDFIYAGGIKFERKEKGWMVGVRDVIFNLHENGGLHQYAMMGIPQVTFGMLGDKLILPPLSEHLGMVRLNIPLRGGLSDLNTPDRWRRALKKEKP